MKLRQTITNILADSLIFQRIASRGVFDWLTTAIGKTIDFDYYLNHSGDKEITPLFNELYRYMKDGEITESQLYDLLVDNILLNYKDKWDRLYNAFVEEEYKPLENYSMIEQENTGMKIETQNNQSNDVYGFNSTDPVPSATADATQTTTGNIDDNERKLTRSGNIGITTSQQMLQSEIDLRQWNFYKQMMKDVDDMLTLDVY